MADVAKYNEPADGTQWQVVGATRFEFETGSGRMRASRSMTGTGAAKKRCLAAWQQGRPTPRVPIGGAKPAGRHLVSARRLHMPSCKQLDEIATHNRSLHVSYS